MKSDQFKKARLKLGLTQKQLGALMAISQPHLSDIERGARQPTNGQAAHMRNLQKWQDGDEFPAL